MTRESEEKKKRERKKEEEEPKNQRHTFQCSRVGVPVIWGNASSCQSPSRVLAGSSVSERRDMRLPSRASPGMLMMPVLDRRSVSSESDSVDEVEPAVRQRVTLWDGNSSHRRSTAGMYMGRPPDCVCSAGEGDGGVEW